MGTARLAFIATSQRIRPLRGLAIAAGAPEDAVQGLEDPLDLLGQGSGGIRRAVLDADATPASDAGILARWLRGDPERSILWIGEASSAAAMGDHGAAGEHLPWPLDLDQLGNLVRESAGGARSMAIEEGPALPQGLARRIRRTHPGNGPVSSASTANDPGRPGDSDEADLRRIAGILAARGAQLAPLPGSPSTSAGGPHALDGTPGGLPPTGPTSVPSEGYEPKGHASDRPAPGSLTSHLASLPGQGISPLGLIGGPRPSNPRTALLRAPSRESRQGTAGDGRPQSSQEPLPRRAHLTHRAAGPPQGATGRASGERVPSDGDGLLEMDGPLLTAEELDAFFGDPIPSVEELAAGAPTHAADLEPANELEEDVEVPSSDDDADPTLEDAPDPAARTRPRWLKDQVADLADIVQALDLRARANHAHVVLGDDLARLRQFTRTIGLVAAPPGRGDQEFDVAVVVEEILGGLAGTQPDSPRLLFRRIAETSLVEADKALVVCGLDALLQTAVSCAGAGDVIRVSVEGGGEAAPIEISIQFPKGPTADVEAPDLLSPYALKDTLPAIGSNALAAAGGIAVGQGGDLVVEDRGAHDRAFRMSLPSLAAAEALAGAAPAEGGRHREEQSDESH